MTKKHLSNNHKRNNDNFHNSIQNKTKTKGKWVSPQTSKFNMIIIAGEETTVFWASSMC